MVFNSHKLQSGFRKRTACVIMVMMIMSSVLFLIPGFACASNSMQNYYLQPQDSVDVLVMGSSPTRSGINTNVLWEEFGIASYSLNGPEEPYWITYYKLKEALKTQTPMLIILDAKAAIYPDDYCSQIRIVANTFDILSEENRVEAIRVSLENQDELQGYLDAAAEYQRTGKVKGGWTHPDGDRAPCWKGYIEVDKIDEHKRPSFSWNYETTPINAREEEYVRKIIELVKETGIPMVFVATPNPDYAYDHKYFNYLWGIAYEYGISWINYNDPDMHYGLRYMTDFADWQHLNVRGGIIFTRQLGKDLKTYFDLPDRRGDPKYASYDECAWLWYEKYPTFMSSDPEKQPLTWFDDQGTAQQ
ncbi:MAG: hypothetical protein IK127_06320 [Clostridia bacterium]|nr:hypothetical protein [Clostridia bacterium]